MKITIEAAEDDHTRFRLRVDEKLVDGVLTAAQAELAIGEILQHIALPATRRAYLPADLPHVAKRAPNSLWALPDEDESWPQMGQTSTPELARPAAASSPTLAGGSSRDVLGQARRVLGLRHLLKLERRKALSG